jgi:hypothetical protein
MEIEFIDTSEMMNWNEDSKEVEPVYKIEVAANRYDLLSLEGLSLALRSFLHKEPSPEIKVKQIDNPVKVTID